ncbi:Acyl-coenzyme A thioesterase 13 [Amphibalanus amphitrite]|uniref:Acyl-coenzyme A thioesterase 13 n=3 Tax=Amphibalanus amphitrite TaxID=1232801 RepID=A0A6A4VA32_AMPAM|nr:Acyl-coenzyme A thioesterase 13 [Amphibalanus amphitrite]
MLSIFGRLSLMAMRPSTIATRLYSGHDQHVFSMVQQILKTATTTTGFDRMASNMEVVSVEPGKVKVQFKVEEEHLNGHGTLHGGYTSFLTDLISTLALMTTGNGNPGVSTDLSVAYMRSAKLNEIITIDADTLKTGKLLTFSTVDFRNEAGTLIAQGKHTKFVGGGASS